VAKGVFTLTGWTGAGQISNDSAFAPVRLFRTVGPSCQYSALYVLTVDASFGGMRWADRDGRRAAGWGGRGWVGRLVGTQPSTKLLRSDEVMGNFRDIDGWSTLTNLRGVVCGTLPPMSTMVTWLQGWCGEEGPGRNWSCTPPDGAMQSHRCDESEDCVLKPRILHGLH
jgi:hypothetical protein